MRVMTRIGVLFLLFGVGSVVLDLMDRTFTILSWAADYQPWLGIGLAVVGAVLVGADQLVSKQPTAAAPADQFAPQTQFPDQTSAAQQGQYPQQPAVQQQGQFPQQPAVQQQGQFPQQPAVQQQGPFPQPSGSNQ